MYEPYGCQSVYVTDRKFGGHEGSRLLAVPTATRQSLQYRVSDITKVNKHIICHSRFMQSFTRSNQNQPSTSEFVYLLTCGRRNLVSGTQNEIIVELPGLWGMIKVYWLDFSLHFRSCCLLRVCRKFGPKFASHYKPVENEVKFGLSKPYSAI